MFREPLFDVVLPKGSALLYVFFFGLDCFSGLITYNAEVRHDSFVLFCFVLFCDVWTSQCILHVFPIPFSQLHP